MREDLASCTAALTGRPIAGDNEWAARVLADGAADTRKRQQTLCSVLGAFTEGAITQIAENVATAVEERHPMRAGGRMVERLIQ